MVKQFTEFSQKLSPTIYQRLKQALELGKWPDGKRLTQEQQETCMQAIISYEALHVPEQERAGYLGQTCKSQADQVSNTSGNFSVGIYPEKTNR